ncbi:hypothetical protein M378DRAFT_913572 [Amanita muscaria Koide BX008]|uniref:Uncharacterized protein n=1 Tax=Amanita muscaria (strain Koide BX008) TaxID=946122 RepID=A0A0C2WBX5_AMAMK|nr:hypothetical protein M378DRAFT_913572 [Amanita muscaria Koide BX008]
MPRFLVRLVPVETLTLGIMAWLPSNAFKFSYISHQFSPRRRDVRRVRAHDRLQN